MADGYQEEAAIFDEQQVPPYSLPNPLVTSDGNDVDADLWQSERRAEVLTLLSDHVYGRTPAAPLQTDYRVVTAIDDALDGTAHRKEIEIVLAGDDGTLSMSVLLYLPKNAMPAAPFIGLNFGGNHTTTLESGIPLRPGQDPERAGKAAQRWPAQQIVGRGYAVMTAHCDDLHPDRADGRGESIGPLFGDDETDSFNRWGAIGMWAWGLSRMLDYAMIDPDLDTTRATVIGHSRLGKTALWAGAQDERFAMAVSNNSGCGGAALSRRRFGETVRAINQRFPHWFCPKFSDYNGDEDALPIDQHMLLATLAPRPLYVASAEEDLWADPRGEYLSAWHASPVFTLLGRSGLRTADSPPVGIPIARDIGYHIRPGAHDITPYDWERYMDFADTQLAR